MGGLLLLPEIGMAQAQSTSQAAPKTKTMIIQSDMLPTPSAEEVDPIHPFFAAPSTGNELIGRIEELDDRVKKLEEKVGVIEKEMKNVN